MLKNCVIYSLNRTFKQSFILRYLLLFSTAPQMSNCRRKKSKHRGADDKKIQSKKVWLERLVISGRLGEIDEVGSEKGQSERWPFRAVTCLGCDQLVRKLLSLGNAKKWLIYVHPCFWSFSKKSWYVFDVTNNSEPSGSLEENIMLYVCRHSVVNHCLKN